MIDSLRCLLRSLTRIAFAALLGISGCASARHDGGAAHSVAERRFDGCFALEGDEEFQSRVQAALMLLQTNCPESYQQVRRYAPRIRQGEHSGMWAYLDPPTMELARPTYMASSTWLASAIAHDSHHSRLYHEYRERHGPPVPDEAWGGTAMEQACNAFQNDVLHCVEAPQSEIDWLAKQDGTHWDTNGDGRHDWSDRQRQNW